MNQQWTTNGFLYHIDRSLEEHSLVTCVKIWSYKKLCLSLSILIIPIISLIRISNLLPYARGICRKRTSPICRTRNYFRFKPVLFLLILNFECSLDHLLFFQLLEEAYHYKRPKDRQGKSEMFRVSES